MGKQYLVNQLQNIETCAEVGVISLNLLSEEKNRNMLEKYDYLVRLKKAPDGIQNLQITLTGKDLVNELQENGHEILSFFKGRVYSSLIRESFELVKQYCIDTDQVQEFKRIKWYHFIRIIRNCLSHTIKLEARGMDLENDFPVTWRHLSIDKEMIGKALEDDFLADVDIWWVFDDLRNFVIEKFK